MKLRGVSFGKKVLCLVGIMVLVLGLTGCGSNTLRTKDGKRLKITEAETNHIEYEDFDNGTK